VDPQTKQVNRDLKVKPKNDRQGCGWIGSGLALPKTLIRVIKGYEWSETENIQGVQMQSEIKVGQRFKFNILSDNSSQERQAVVTRVLSNSEEGLGPEVDYYMAYWVEAYEVPETEAPTTLVFERGVDGNAYLDGRQVSITLLN
jgi:hypothetical protein